MQKMANLTRDFAPFRVRERGEQTSCCELVIRHFQPHVSCLIASYCLRTEMKLKWCQLGCETGDAFTDPKLETLNTPTLPAPTLDKVRKVLVGVADQS